MTFHLYRNTTALLLAEQQAREAEVQRQQLLNLHALNTYHQMPCCSTSTEDIPKDPANLATQPYYPSHFFRGTVLQVNNDLKKLVENLEFDDFRNVSELAASNAHKMNMRMGRVVELKASTATHSILITFEVEKQLANGDLEASISRLL